MIEITVLNYLDAHMNVPVRMEISKDLSGEFVVIEKTGGGEHNHVKTSTFAVQSYGSSMIEAAKLNDTILDIMPGIIEVPEVSKCSLNSNYYFADIATKRYRYQAVFDMVHF